MGLSDFLDNDKNFFSLSLTLCDMLAENMFDHLVKLVSYTHVNQILMTFQTILCLALNVKKGANQTITHIFLDMHNVQIMLYM